MAIYKMDVDLTWSGASGSPGVNVWHFRAPDPDVDQGAAKDAADNLQTFYSAIKAYYPSDVSMHFNGEVRTEVSGDNDPAIYNIGHSWTVQGTSTSGFAPPANAVMLSLRSSSATRSGRGRKFLGPVEVGIVQSNGTVGESIRAAIEQAGIELIASAAGPANGAWAIWSNSQKVARDIVSVSVPNKFGVLRSRRD